MRAIVARTATGLSAANSKLTHYRPARRTRGRTFALASLKRTTAAYTALFPYPCIPMADTNLSSFIWSVADLLRGNYKQSEYGKVILPFSVLRRLDCVLEPTKAAVLAELAANAKAKWRPEPFLLRKSGQHFFSTSALYMKKLMGDQDPIKENLFAYIEA